MIDVDKGHIVYGPHKLSAYEAQSFAQWLDRRNLNYGRPLLLWPPGSTSFNAAWLSMKELLLGEWESLQDKYIEESRRETA